MIRAGTWLEYRAGTFASDAGETLSLTVKEKLPTSLRFEIYVITGKTYTIERTTDGATWERVPFSVDVFTEGSAVYTATRVGVVSAFTASSLNSGGELYRLTVR
jgi:hypothetical protein